ncbi:hypothetical protein SELMODRAFT_444273 [Selaginella moellendorffii]|uniref:Uncharacterized protein n=1 Tax=Selaginella moellendorffii TaxID=88036 RepID=D8S8L3_SELML|nr:uncharacterized protein LOC9635188 [Selaginella moellendorffii]XP_002985369.1 uncharacterized protein LOC9649877 [Selaginella moellendorffii]EFJ13499.1 hypothetical protein SELMODRAFT_446262 [Selaginella moellendorffii]EFJ19063.1 hypothetical protein SELMODRAFT_444273 [Selaginella moellendorffii]|eukprot:XP_002979661.1 uncharacterized protein LOC9635188 [Selaginella moellendorffii]
MAVKNWVSRLDSKGKIVCSLVVALSVFSAILGFSAEGERVRPDEVRRVNGACTYPKSSALGLGISAALFLLAAQVLVNVFGGCICCERRSSSSFVSMIRLATLSLIASWITFFFAFILLVVGASLNQRHQDDHWFTGQCFVVKRGVFAGAAVLSLATGALGVLYYFAASETRKQDWQSHQPGGVTMGQSYGAHQFGSYSPYPQSSQFPSI